MKMLPIILAVSILAGFGVAHDTQPSGTKNGGHQKADTRAQHPADKAGKGAPSIESQTVIYGEATKPDKQSRPANEAHPPHDALDWVNALSTFVIAAFTVAMFWAIYNQLRTTHRLERAWLMLRPEKYELPPTTGKLDWNIINVGKTMARIIQAQARCRVTDSDKRRLEDTPIYFDNIPVHNMPLAPNWQEPFWCHVEPHPREYKTLSPKDFADITSGAADLVFHGFVKYLDAFGKTHESRFCYYWAPYAHEFRINLRAPAEYHRCT